MGPRQADTASRNYKIWSNKCTALDIEEWYNIYEADRSIYKATLPSQEETIESLRAKKHKIAFFKSHFEAGLRLPLDPFIAEFFDFTKSVPLDLPYNSMLALISFAAVCRSLCFEPTVFLLSHFFRFGVSGKGETRLIGRGVGGDVPRLFKPFPNKKPGWDSKCFLVESISGWPFPRYTDGPIKLVDKDVYGGGDNSLKDHLYNLVGYSISAGDDEVERWSQTHLVDWERIV